MNEQQLAAVKQALEALELHGNQYPHMVKGYCLDAITALQSIISQDALDWMAKNARELGLDYEPAPVPLTDEQILEIKAQFVWTLDFQFTEFARAIEAAHGITTAPEKGN
jgi:hypothetical protein